MSDLATVLNSRFVVDADGNAIYERWDPEDFQQLLDVAECPTCYRRTGGDRCSACVRERRTSPLETSHPLLVRRCA